MKSLVLLLLLFIPFVIQAQDLHHRNWGKPRAEIEVKYSSDDYEQVSRSEESTCYDWKLLRSRVCVFFTTGGEYRAFGLTRSVTWKKAGKEITEYAQKYGTPEQYFADFTEVQDLETATALAENTIKVIYPTNPQGTRLTIMMRTTEYPGDEPRTTRLLSLYEDTSRN